MRKYCPQTLAIKSRRLREVGNFGIRHAQTAIGEVVAVLAEFEDLIDQYKLDFEDEPIMPEQKRDALKSWTILLAILTFALSLLGTFLVRSGVLTSVHSFASDPERGVFILVLLIIIIGGALMLYAVRAPSLKSGGMFAPISREGALVLNNLLLATAAAVVFLGTLYPLFLDAFGGGRISVGAPFFNSTFVPIMTPLLIACVIGAMMGWKRGDVPGVLALSLIHI